MTRIIFLCAGQENRWKSDTLKQLVPVDGEPVLHRTVRLLRSFGYHDIHIAHHNPKLRVEGCKHFAPSHSECITSTLHSTRHLWTDHTIILLGDVYFTENALKKILECPAEMMFVGRLGPSSYTGCKHAEMFSILFRRSAHEKFTSVLESVLAETRRLQSSRLSYLRLFLRIYPPSFFGFFKKEKTYPLSILPHIENGKELSLRKRILYAHITALWGTNFLKYLSGELWNPYWKYIGLPLSFSMIESPFFMSIDDFTDDFDSLDDYKTWLANFSKSHVHSTHRHTVTI